jgi:small subunit ribosomal protein S6
MQKYESLFIFHPELKEEKLKKKIEEVKKYITSQKGKIENIKEPNRENLAYPIKKCLEGLHLVLDFEMSPEVVDQFKKKFLKDEKILRYTVLKK